MRTALWINLHLFSQQVSLHIQRAMKHTEDIYVSVSTNEVCNTIMPVKQNANLVVLVLIVSVSNFRELRE
jgi:hypothetical protein